MLFRSAPSPARGRGHSFAPGIGRRCGKNGDMKILDVLRKEAVVVNLKSREKKGVIEELAAPLASLSGIARKDLVKVLMERERLGSTGIGGGIGIPHGKMKGIDSLLVGFGLSREGVNFESIDGRPTHIFFVLVTPEDSIDIHLKLLSQISRILKDDLLKQRLRNAGTPDAVMEIIRDEDVGF